MQMNTNTTECIQTADKNMKTDEPSKSVKD